MNLSTRILASSCIAAFIIGCGGAGGGGGTIPTRINVLAHAPSAGQGQGISQLTGFIGRKPAFLSYEDTSHWTVNVVGQAPVNLSTTSFSNAYLSAFDNGIAVGGCDSGSFAYRLTQSGWVATSFPGVSTPVLDAPESAIIGQLSDGSTVRVDVATGTQTTIAIPTASVIYFAKANWIIYIPSPQVTLTSFLVRNIQTGVEWQDSEIPGDTSTFPYALNASGGVIGESNAGQSTEEAIYWAPVTGAPHVIDSYNATIEPGWISPDGNTAVVNVLAINASASFMYVNGTKYPVATLQGGSAVAYLYGLSDDGRTGFGLGDPNLDPTSTVAVGISYR